MQLPAHLICGGGFLQRFIHLQCGQLLKVASCVQDGQASGPALKEHALLDISSPATSMPGGSSKPSTVGSTPASHDASLGSDASDTAAEHDERPGLLHEDMAPRAADSPAAAPERAAAAAGAAEEAPVPPTEPHENGDHRPFMGPLLCGMG